MPAPKKIRIIVAFAALYSIWGSTYLGIRFAIETIPPFLMAGARFLLAGVIMYAIAWSQDIVKWSWANWRTSLIIGACLLLGGNGGVTISEKYIDSGLAAVIVTVVPIYIVVLGWATGMAPRPTAVVWGRLCWRWDFTWPVVAVFLERSTPSRYRDVDPACFILPLVGGIVVFAGGETCGFPFFDRCPTDDLWRITFVARRRVDWRNATIPSRLGVELVNGFVCLFGHYWGRGWIHRLHLAVAPL